jgi:hypothetical protein
VLSAFEYQCAGCYNIPFTGLKLIPLVKTYYTYITKYYPVWKKFVNFNSEMVSDGLYFVMDGFYNPKVVNPRDFTVSIPSLILLINGYLISIMYDTCIQDFELIQTLYHINLVDVFSNIEYRILKKSKLVHSKIFA